MAITRLVLFTREGKMLKAEKTLDGRPTAIEDTEVKGTLEHAKALAMSVKNASTAPVQGASVKGTVTYLQRIALAPDAQVRVSLIAPGSRSGREIVVAQQTMGSHGRVPVPFEIRYDPASIIPSSDYVLVAEILIGENVIFKNMPGVPVITKGNPTSVEVVVQPAR